MDDDALLEHVLQVISTLIDLDPAPDTPEGRLLVGLSGIIETRASAAALWTAMNREQRERVLAVVAWLKGGEPPNQ